MSDLTLPGEIEKLLSIGPRSRKGEKEEKEEEERGRQDDKERGKRRSRKKNSIK